MPLGKTWWHGAIVKRQDSYVAEEGHPVAKFDEEAWEATQRWEHQRHALRREADALLDGKWDRRLGEKIVSEVEMVKPTPQFTDEDVLLIAALLIIME